MDNWLTEITTWLLSLVKAVFTALLDFFHDVALWVFDTTLQAIAGLISAIPAPSFLSGGLNLGTIFSGFPPYFFFVASNIHIGAAFAIVGAGVAFRLTRKLFTLGQW